MADAQQRLPLHFDIVGQQQVEVLCDRAGQGVLNGDDGGLDGSLVQRGKDVGGERTGNDHGIGDQFDGRFVAE